jgi:D-glycero-D-manno-heptose 1,7-bisphosphate phosphatase
MKSLALFLDRDGVVNTETDYVWRIKDFNFVNDIFRLCEKFQKAGYKIFIITNQSGISRGYYSEADFLNLTDWMLTRFLENRITISKVYYCPHHPDITGHCNCRKPNPGLINQAEMEFDIDLSNSILIGDSISDILAGKNAGVGTNILIPTNIIPKYLLSTPHFRSL